MQVGPRRGGLRQQSRQGQAVVHESLGVGEVVAPEEAERALRQGRPGARLLPGVRGVTPGPDILVEVGFPQRQDATDGAPEWRQSGSSRSALLRRRVSARSIRLYGSSHSCHAAARRWRRIARKALQRWCRMAYSAPAIKPLSRIWNRREATASIGRKTCSSKADAGR